MIQSIIISQTKSANHVQRSLSSTTLNTMCKTVVET